MVGFGRPRSVLGVNNYETQIMKKFSKYHKKNHGFGRQRAYAIRQALAVWTRSLSFGSKKAHADRAKVFNRYLDEFGLKDARDISVETVAAYADWLKDREYSAARIENCISTVNCIMSVMRPWWVRVSPSRIAGLNRLRTRMDVPGALDWAVVDTALAEMKELGYRRAAAVIWMARAFGMRLREACLADYDRLLREARTMGRINIQEGTKGGRKVRREVPVSERGWKALEYAVAMRPPESSNLVDPSEQYIEMIRRELFAARRVLKKHGIKGYHDARSAFACDMYRQLTGAPAPVETGGRTISAEKDRDAREKLSRMLGHGRIDVVSAYCGGRRKAARVPEIDCTEDAP